MIYFLFYDIFILKNIMNRSYSKIRHIQESNVILEQKRFNKLLEAKTGDVKPLVREQGQATPATAPAPAAGTPQGLDTTTGGAGGKLRGGISRLRTGLSNLGSAVRGDSSGLKNPELEAILTRVKTNTTQMQKQLSDTYNALNQLKSSVNSSKVPAEMKDEMTALQTQIDTYLQTLGSLITQTDNFNKYQIPYSNASS